MEILCLTNYSNKTISKGLEVIFYLAIPLQNILEIY